jgi:hypothetical protein
VKKSAGAIMVVLLELVGQELVLLLWKQKKKKTS